MSQKSTINKSIEITWNNGELVLDTENTNYSYGSLQRILKKDLKEIVFEKIRKFKKKINSWSCLRKCNKNL